MSGQPQPAGTTERPRRTLQGQIGAVMMVVILIFATNFFFIKFHLDKIQDDAYITDALGRQRMLVMRIAYDADRMHHGDTTVIDDIDRSIETYRLSHDTFKRGGPIPGITNGEDVRRLPDAVLGPVLESEEEWTGFMTQVMVVRDSPGTPESEEAMLRINDIAPAMVEMNDVAVKTYTAYSLHNERMLLLWTIISLSSSAGVVLLFWQGVNRHLTAPLRKIIDATKAVERGEYSTRVDIRTRDEIEDLALAFNRAAEALAKAEAEHKEVDKAKVTFLTMASHELRSPMTPIKAQLQMLLEDYFGKLNKKQREAATIALRNADHLDVVIQDMLELSRIEAAKIAFSFAETDIVKEIDLTVKGMAQFCSQKNVRVILNADRVPRIQCDPGRVSQVLRNMLSNAIKFSEDGAEVEVRVEDAPQEVIISVRDRGRGMNDETKRKLFEPFYQEDNIYGRKYGGTGLGLSICKGIVEMMGGRIWFESEQGKGTMFWFSVPKTPPKVMESVNLLVSSDERWKSLLHNK